MPQDLVCKRRARLTELLICESTVWFLTQRAASPQTCIIPTILMDL